MKIRTRPGDERFHSRLDWLDSRHSFSFAEHHHPDWMGFRGLRVLNEDRIAAGTGFGRHGHRDAEILTIVLDGALEHRDDHGHRAVLRPGDVQRMSAGTGVVHSEWNASQTEPVHLVQVWLLPDRTGVEPRYDDAVTGWDVVEGATLLASRDGRDGSLPIHRDAAVFAVRLAPGEVHRHELAPGRAAWLQVLGGAVRAAGTALAAGDGMGVETEGAEALEIEAVEAATLLLFDLD